MAKKATSECSAGHPVRTASEGLTMLRKAFGRHKARRAVVLAAECVAASYEPSLDGHQHDPEDLAELRTAVAKFDALTLFPYRLRWERHADQRSFGYRVGQAPEWPWWELSLPRLGSLILGRKMPRSI